MEGLSDQIRCFCVYLETERNASGHTLAAYRRDLAQLEAFVTGEKGARAGAADVDHLLLRRFLALIAKNVKKAPSAASLLPYAAFSNFSCGAASLPGTRLN